MAHGKHRKKKEPNYKAMAVVAGVGVGASLVGTGTASAATVNDWERVAECESGNRWNIMFGDRDSTGGLQFRTASWSDALAYLRSKGVDTSAYPSIAGQATKQQQIIAGEALLALQGAGAWTCNGMVGSPLGYGYDKSRSMFNGGPNPYAGVSTPAPKPVTPKPKPPVGEPEDAEDGTYVVRQGDTLSGIAAKLDIRGGWKVLYAINKKVIGSDPNVIEVGQKLRLPGHEAPAAGKTAGTYTVKRGDWLAKIAKAKLGAADKWGALYSLNKSVIGADPNLIHPGQKLKLSGAAVTNPVQKPKPQAPKPAPKPPVSNGSYVLPVSGRIGDSLIIGAGGSMSRSAGGHSGLDISAPHGTPVKAATGGRVVSMNSSGGAYGLHVVVQHGPGLYTLYAHLSHISVGVGQSVDAGGVVGNVGSTGNSGGPHLHFEVRNHPTDFNPGNFLNPLTWLRGHGVSV